MFYTTKGNRVAAGLLCALLAACGGGGGGGNSADSGDNGTVLASNPAPAGNGQAGSDTSSPAGQTPASSVADATRARFNEPMGLAMDGAGNLYVADSANFTVRKIAADGTVTTLAGLAGASGSNDGAGSQARFSGLTGIAVDGNGNVYVVDNSAIRKISPAGSVTTLAGAPGAVGSADGSGTAARFNRPWGLAVAANGTVYVADSGNYAVRAVAADGTVTTHAGTAGMRGRADGSRATATFLNPQGIALDGSGNLYVTDWLGPPAQNIPEGSTLLRKIATDGTVSTMAGNMGGETAPALFRDTFAVAADGAGNVYLAAAGSVHHVSPTGTVTPLAIPAGTFQSLEGITLDGSGNLYVADRPGHAISRLTPSGVPGVYAGKPGESGSVNTAP